MQRLAHLFAWIAVLALPVRGFGRAKAEPSEAVRLQDQFQKLIEKTEPAIACILVSRSEEYARYKAAPSSESNGKLGRFFAAPYLKRLPDDRPELAKTIKALDLSRPDQVPEAFGSGVVIDNSGLVLTCAHVVRRATKIYVRLPGLGGSYADIYAADPRSDFAVLKLLDPPAGLKALKFGDGDKLRKGQWIVSLSNPYAVGFRDGSPSASVGIVSNLRRRGPSVVSEYEAGRQPLHAFGTLLQTDVRVNLGCSGGAILNLDGDLVGLTTALAALSGGETPGGFAIPFDTPMKRIVEVLRRGKEVEYGFLGIQMAPEVQPGTPVRIADTVIGGPAAQAGLQAGDVIVAIDGRPIHDRDDLLLQVSIGLAGNEVKVEVERGFARERLAMTVRLVKSPVLGSVIAANRPRPRAGLIVDHASIFAKQTRAIPVGVAIREVVPGSPADLARLQAGKIIKRVNGRLVATPAAFQRAMEDAGTKIELTVLDFSGQQEETVTIDNK